MGIPFRCRECGGAESQCAIRRQYEKQNKGKKVKEVDSEDNHVHCEGGQFCYSREIVARSGKYIVLKCQYGSAFADVSRTGHTVYSAEFSDFFEGWGDVKLVADEFLCFDCYRDRRRDNSLIEVDPTVVPDDHEYRKKHATYVLNKKLNIPMSVVQHQIFPYLNNCCARSSRFDCLLCSVFQQSDYEGDILDEMRREKERQRENEERSSKKARLR